MLKYVNLTIVNGNYSPGKVNEGAHDAYSDKLRLACGTLVSHTGVCLN